MNQSQRILAIEIRTMDNSNLEPSQISSITIYENSGSYYLTLDLSQIRAVIIEAVKTIISLGNNYRHPLYFDVQIVPGSGMETGVPLTPDRDRPKGGRQRRKKRTN